jgi:tRNA threonylcarbamoyladenosine modification (KEOPS) complex  Pcc1 subunit
MEYKSEIKVYGDVEKLAECFEAEEKIKEDRSTVKMVKKKDHLLFDIEAKDSTSLRATLTGITKLCTVFEKMESIKNG